MNVPSMLHSARSNSARALDKLIPQDSRGSAEGTAPRRQNELRLVGGTHVAPWEKPRTSEYEGSQTLSTFQILTPCKTQTTSASRTVDAMALHGEATASARIDEPNAAQAVEVSTSRTGGANPPTGAGELTFFGFKRGLNSVTNSDRRGDGARAAHGRAIRMATDSVLKTDEAQALGSSTLSPSAHSFGSHLHGHPVDRLVRGVGAPAAVRKTRVARLARELRAQRQVEQATFDGDLADFFGGFQ